MENFKTLNKEQLLIKRDEYSKKYQTLLEKGLKLDMSRGKPGADQLDLSDGLLSILSTGSDCKDENNVDLRNYGGLDGIPEAKRIFAQMLEVAPQNIIISGNASLNLMFDQMSRAMLFGVYGSERPWNKEEKVKFLCPSPGYDRHFTICEAFGMEMITVPMLADGPDMDVVEKLVAGDAAIKGIWCVPKYSNPQGITYSEKVVKRLGALKPKAKDFRIFYDNAYIVHHLSDTPDKLYNIFDACNEGGNPDMIFEFTSTSKITYPGGGVCAMAASENNVKQILKIMFSQTIGPDKLNQIRHCKYFKDLDGITAHMKKHADILKPKFDIVCNALTENFKDSGLGTWNTPNGGYFVSFDALDGCAKRILELAKNAGVTMTSAGATYPYGIDPQDKNIRIAPTFPPVAELKIAMEVFVVCVFLASIEKLLD